MANIPLWTLPVVITEPTANEQTSEMAKDWCRIPQVIDVAHELQSIMGSCRYGWRSTRLATNLLPQRGR